MILSYPLRYATFGTILLLVAGPALAQGQAARTGTGAPRTAAGAASGQSAGAAGRASTSGATGGLSVGTLAAGLAAAAAIGALAIVATDSSGGGGGASSAASTQKIFGRQGGIATALPRANMTAPAFIRNASHGPEHVP